MQRLLTVLGWASLPLELMTVTAVHPCDTRPDLYPSTVEFQNGAYDWGLTFDGPERIESLEQSIVDIERILIADIDPFDGIGGVCDGGRTEELNGSRITCLSAVVGSQVSAKGCKEIQGSDTNERLFWWRRRCAAAGS